VFRSLAQIAFRMLLPALVFGAVSVPASAGTMTDIPLSAAGDPKLLWRAVMEGFYGPYDRASKCWMGTIDGRRHCMRPHKLDAVTTDGRELLFIVTGGYPIGENGGRNDCHACPGSLGLIVLGKTAGGLELIARNSLADETGAWGTVPVEENFRLRKIGDARYGWTMESGWTGQGYHSGWIDIFGISGSDVVEFGSVPIHADNSGTCGDGLGACFVKSYEIVFDEGADGSFYGIVLRRLEESTEGPASFSIGFDPGSLSYEVPEEVIELLRL
jgi:hypothetical protein